MSHDHIPNGRLWLTPIKTYSDYLSLSQEVGIDAVNRLGKYQRVREARILATLCFAMYMRMGTPWYLQLDESENTDGRVMRLSPNDPGSIELLNVEITTYMRRADGTLPLASLLEQLKITKTFPDHHKYGEHDLLLVELGSNMQINFDEIADYLKSIDAPYQVWAIEEVEPENGDTICQVTVCTPSATQLRLDIGEAWHLQLQADIRGSLTTRRSGDVSKAGIRKNDEPITRAPWEFS